MSINLWHSAVPFLATKGQTSYFLYVPYTPYRLDTIRVSKWKKGHYSFGYVPFLNAYVRNQEQSEGLGTFQKKISKDLWKMFMLPLTAA